MSARAYPSATRLAALILVGAATFILSCGGRTMSDAMELKGSQLLRCASYNLSFRREKSDDANQYDVVIAEGCGNRAALQCMTIQDKPEYISGRGRMNHYVEHVHYECVDYCVGTFVVSRTCPGSSRL